MRLRLKGLHVPDLHFTRKPPIARTDTYASEIIEMLRELRGIAKDFHYTVLHGDLFHRKGRTSHGDVIALAGELRDWPCPLLAIPGNHDMIGNNVEHCYAEQPFGVLARMGVLRSLHDEPFYHNGCAVLGAPYCGSYRKAFRKLAKFDKGKFGTVVALHEDFSYPSARRILNRWQRPIVVVNGHIHDERGAWGNSEFRFANIGSLARTSRLEADLIPKALAVIIREDKTARLIDVPLQCLSPSEAFVPVETDPQANAELDEFIRQLRKSPSRDFDNVKAIRRLAKRAGVPKRVTKRAIGLLQESVG